MGENDLKPLVQLKSIYKSFPGVKVLNNVSINFYSGKVHVLLGENGAGKSTIIKIITGIYKKDDGEVIVDGVVQNFSGIKQSKDLGISVIHQELSVIDDLMVYENIFLGREFKKNGFIDKRKAILETQKLFDAIGILINPKSYIRDLTNGDKQMVEIVRAISQNSRLVIMDEPTSSLSEKEVSSLFKVINRLKSENVGVIYISHKLKEIVEIGDTLTVLRDGVVVNTLPVNDVTEDEMVTMMVGREIKNYYYKALINYNVEQKVVLETKNLTRNGYFDNVSFKLYQGEILGVAGLIGAGRTEIVRAIFSADRADSGFTYINGTNVTKKTSKDIIKLGVGLIPEDRKQQGLLLEKNLKENISLASLYENSKKGFINFSWEQQSSKEYIKKLKIKTPSENFITKNLSGGNQQKVVIAKWLLANSNILIMDEPTRGIDVNAKSEIYYLMKLFVENGGSIVLISSELTEIIGCSNRVIVIRDGKLTGTLEKDITEENIMKLASKEIL